MSIAVDPSGSYAYVPNQDGTVWQYTIGSGGKLTNPGSLTINANANLTSIKVDPSGSYAYVTDETDNYVSQFKIGAGGSLESLTPPTVSTGPGSGPAGMAFDPTGSYAYVVNGNSGTVSQFKIGSGGALTSITPAKVNTAQSPRSIVTVAKQ